VAVCAATSVHARTWLVDDDALDCFDADYATVQAAIDAAEPRDVVVVCPGVYEEQLVIRKPMRLVGQRIGSSVPIIRPMLLSETVVSGLSGNPLTAGVLVDAEPPVGIEGLELDMSQNLLMGCSPILTGILFFKTTGWVTGTHISGTRVPGHPECDGGVALYVESMPGDPTARVRTGDNVYEDYQKGAVVGNGEGAYLRIERSEAIGSGPTAGAVQNGYQLGFGARGRFRDVTATDHETTTPGAVAAGVLAANSGRVKMRTVNTADGQVGIYAIGSRFRITRNQLTNLTSDAILAIGDQNKIAGNTIDTVGEVAVFVDGELNFVGGGSIANSPLGVWMLDPNNRVVAGIDFAFVPEQVRVGGTRDIPAPAPFSAQ
jgi:hypothetical protein